MKALEISNLDQHLKPVQIDGVSTGLELSTTDLRISTGELSIKNLTAETFSVDGDIDMNGSSTSINMSSGVALNSTHTAGDLTIYSKNIALHTTLIAFLSCSGKCLSGVTIILLTIVLLLVAIHTSNYFKKLFLLFFFRFFFLHSS